MNGTVSASYIHKLEHGIDVAISPEILVMFQEVLSVSHNELLGCLSEKNYIRYSRYLIDRRALRVSESGGGRKEQG